MSVPERTGRPATSKRPLASRNLHFLSKDALKTGLHVVGGPGTGKSWFVGRALIPQTLVQGSTDVVLDPTGGIVDAFADKVARLPVAQRKRAWSRIVYVDVGATDFVVPSPLYYRLSPNDTLFEIANRLPTVFRLQDPQLQSAPILGWNSLFECAIYAGQIAAALGRQVDFVADLIAQPRLYKHELRHALAEYPELAAAVAYFREMMDPTNASLRERRTGSLGSKLLPFMADPTMLATFAASKQGVDWEEVEARRQVVLVDFRHERDPERRRFKLIWWFRSFIDYVKLRGMAGRGREIFFVIDEVTQLTGQRDGQNRSIFADELEELIAVLARNYGINVVVMHQNLSQVDESIRNVLMQCGTQMVGNITNPEDAEFLARQLFRYDPYKIKQQEPVWMALEATDRWGIRLGYSEPKIIDHRTIEFTPEEQVLQAVATFRLPRFQFLVRPATAEGTISDKLYRISIENLDKGQYPDAAQVAQTLALLRQKCGLPVEILLAEIRERRQPAPEGLQRRVKTQAPPAILDENEPQLSKQSHPTAEQSHDHDTLPPSPEAEEPKQGRLHDDFWR